MPQLCWERAGNHRSAHRIQGQLTSSPHPVPALRPVSGARVNRKLETPHGKPKGRKRQDPGERKKERANSTLKPRRETRRPPTGLCTPYRTEEKPQSWSQDWWAHLGTPVQASLIGTSPPLTSEPVMTQIYHHILFSTSHIFNILVFPSLKITQGPKLEKILGLHSVTFSTTCWPWLPRLLQMGSALKSYI